MSRCTVGSIIAGLAGGAIALGVTVALALSHAPLPANPSAALLGLQSHGRWAVYHIGVTDCRCTARLFEHLASRPRRAGLEESVILLGDGTPPPALAAAGLPTSNFSVQKALDAGIQGGPWIVVLAPDGRIAYSGGYDAPPVWDADIVERTMTGHYIPTRDIVGCAVGREPATGTRWRKLLTPQ